jgi:uncharacterized protein with beta-barrel porin domain
MRGHFECTQVVGFMRKTISVAIRSVFIATLTILLILAISGDVALAADGDGGAGANGASGGAGATGVTGSDGGNGSGQPGCFNCGGGGGGGGASGTIAGGNGGTGGGADLGSSPVAGGQAGSGGSGVGAGGGTGGAGTNNGSGGSGGGGGGGGAAGNGGTGSVVSNSIGGTGGGGGGGGDAAVGGTGLTGGGGGGGAGGFGAIVDVNVQSNFAVAAGNGGNGGAGGSADSSTNNFGAIGGNGGSGGTGLQGILTGLGIANSASIAGGNGGVGGSGGTSGPPVGGAGGNGGNGGSGGNGVVLTGGILTNSGSIVAGNGGAGGVGGNGGGFSMGGNGGGGGNGVVLTAGTLTNSGSITAGNGGAGGVGVLGFFRGSNGVGGVGVIGSGITIINNGTIMGGLSADGVTRADAIVFTGGTNFLGGTGTVGSFTMISGGTFAPGSGVPGSKMIVSGNLGFQSGAIYSVQVSPAASSFANVTGTATLGGATVNAAFANGNYVSKQYTILTATGGLGGTTFSGVTNTNLPQGASDSLSYSANDVFLNLKAAFTNYSDLNVNQQNVANALTNFFNATGGIPSVFFGLSPGSLTQVSGELATGSQQTTFDAMNLFMGVMTDPFASGRGDGGTTGVGAPIGYASAQNSGAARDAYAMFTKAPPVTPFEQRWSVWAAGFGGSQTTDGNVALGSNTSTSSIYGTAVGADYRFSPNTIAGFALAGGGTNFSVAGSGSGHSDLFQAGAFIRHTVGQAYLSAALAYGWQDITTNRTVTAAGSDQLRAQFNANAFSGRLEGGYRFVAPWVGGIGITPYTAAQFTTFDLPGYAEQAVVGSNAFALAYGAKDVTDTRSELGIRTDKSFALTDGVLILRARAAWAHDYDPDRSIAATFQTLPGASFVLNGAPQAADSALATASVEKKWLSGWSAAATFEGEFSDVTRSYAGKGVVRYQW